MSFSDDDDILQDFLVEAGEIIEALSEQLVDLEQRPDDRDLLNAIFRGFHTVKGGAGFLQLNTMVDCCHVTENLFDILRNGQRSVTPELMDVVLQALDTVTSQFSEITNGDVPSPADPALIAKLEALVAGEDPVEPVAHSGEVDPPTEALPDTAVDVQQEQASDHSQSEGLELTDDEFEGFLDAIGDSDQAVENSTTTTEESAKSTSHDNSASITDAGDEITEDEFEALLDQLHGSGKAPGVGEQAATESGGVGSGTAQPKTKEPDEISEDEFEALLDQLHGAGQGPGKTAKPEDNKDVSPPENSATETTKKAELITDDEFEDLLDQLHGKGKGPTIAAADDKEKTPATPAATPAIADTKAKAAAPAPSPEKPSAVSAPAGDQKRNLSAAPKPRDNARSAPGQQQSGTAAETTVRVDTQRLDDIMNMVGELVLVRNRLVRLGLESADESMQKAVANLDVVTADLQTAVMKTRMQPIKKVFGRFPRVVRDLARNLKKEINLDLVGEDTDLDKNLVEALADPLVHLVRNSVDHGIELPAVREQNGKSRVGKVILAAEQEGDHILLSITDDGGGMDPQKLRAKAVEKGILDEDSAARLSDTEAFNLIFAPGFSTKTEISDVSGRGVGMDVVKTKITQLNGSIEINSKLGEGTRIAIKVPLTLAIMPTLMIMLADQTFALPLVSVNEIFHMDLTKTNIVDGQECVTIREKAIPIFHLKRWLVKKPVLVGKLEEAHVVIVSVGTQRVGFVVDQLIGQEEVVIKPLGKMLHGTPGMAGATITGDGTIALILDVPSMLKRYAKTA